MRKGILIGFIILSANLEAICGPNGAPIVADNPLHYIDTSPGDSDAQYEQWAATQLAAAQAIADNEEAKREKIAALEQANQDHLASLKLKSEQAALDATNADDKVANLRQNLLAVKLRIPVDPWREIDGKKNYVMSEGSEFVKFTGQVLEIVPEGIRMKGSFGEESSAEYFITNFPYGYTQGESLDNGKIYVAVKNGDFTYVTLDGAGKSIPELDYGKACDRPANADEVEAAAKELTSDEQEQIKKAKYDAIAKHDYAIVTDHQYHDFLKTLEDYYAAKIQALHASEDRALKFNEEQAAENDPTGLLRMGERYRDGNGVPKDIAKARDYFIRAVAAGSPSAAQELSQLKETTTTAATVRAN